MRVRDGSFLSRIGSVTVRVIRAEITVTTGAGPRRESYQLVTTVCDPACPALELVGLYHERWETSRTYTIQINTLAPDGP